MDHLQQKPKVLILGTFHMRHSPDLFRTDFPDLLEPKRQHEIKEVVNRLINFQPTKIAFEVVTNKNESLNDDYKKYKDGKLELEVNEVHQFGFRVAAHMNHDRVYAIDWMELIGNRALGHVYQWAEEHQPELFRTINEKYRQYVNDDSDLTILQMLSNRNDEQNVRLTHEMYMQIAKIGNFNDYVGIDWLRWWYQRNLIQYSNITRLATNRNERILFIVGAAHVYLVSQFLRESEDFEVINANYYLKT